MNPSFDLAAELKESAQALHTRDRQKAKLHYDVLKNLLKELSVSGGDVEFAAELYDLLYGLLWVGAQDLTELRVFNEDVVSPFSTMLAPIVVHERPPKIAGNICRLAFLTRSVSYLGGDGVARILLSRLTGFRKAFGHVLELHLYALATPDQSLGQALHELGVIIHDYSSTSSKVDQVVEIFHQARQDGIDVLISDWNGAVPTMLFQGRAAPIQVFMEMGFLPWQIQNLDFLFLGVSDDPANGVGETVPWERIKPTVDAGLLDRAVSHVDIQTMRSRFPDDAFIYGFYGRLIKLTDDYLATVEHLLSVVPSAWMYIGGSGNSEALEKFLECSQNRDRIVVDREFVDGHIAGRILDIFLDTYPFMGGISCLECLFKGVPVVWMKPVEGEHSHHFVIEQRDHTLAASSWRNYLEIALACGSPSARVKHGEAARELAQRLSDSAPGARQMYQALLKMNSSRSL